MKETMHLWDGNTVDVYRCHPTDDVKCPDGTYLPIYNTMSDFTGAFYLPAVGTNDIVFEIKATTIEEAREELEERLRSIDGEYFNEYFKEIYGDGAVMTVTTEDGNTISGLMYGNDECFNVNDFYQILVADGKVYRCFYNLDQLDDNDNPNDLGNIDYDHPCKVEECTNEYED